ncbi:MAG TPA: hypothetical protein VLI90_05930, partial [Tepidisphaeraceae bacterium]|nr:hypothetical protein [Tepidisphaeraceae bacterium]
MTATLHFTHLVRPSIARSAVEAELQVHQTVQQWVDECIDLCQPNDVHICTGSAEEKQQLIERGIEEGIFIKLNQEKLPGCYLHRSNPNDVARTEQSTFICAPSQDMAGPTNN